MAIAVERALAFGFGAKPTQTAMAEAERAWRLWLAEGHRDYGTRGHDAFVAGWMAHAAEMERATT